MAQEISSITLGVLDSNGDGIPTGLTVSYVLIDDADTSFRARGSFTVTSPDFSKSANLLMDEARTEICVREGIDCSSSSSA